jgi:hypothetical protein
MNWLTKENGCKHLFIEKPLDSSLSRARSLQYYAQFYNVNVYAVDHYLARFLPIANSWTMKGFLKEIGDQLDTMTFYLLEDKSLPYNGPIEATHRISTLKHGLVLDMFPHVLAILRLFGKLETIQITGLRVAQYSFDLEDGTVAPAAIGKETFAEISFTIESLLNRQNQRPTLIHVVTYLGKGIAGSREQSVFGSSMKRVELRGSNRKQIVIDLTSAGTVGVLDHKNKVVVTGPPLIDDPYELLVEQVIEKFLWKKNVDLYYLLDLQTAKNTLLCVHEIMTLVQNFLHTNTPLPKYHIKTVIEENGPISLAPSIEEILEKPLLDVFHLVGVKPISDFYVSEITRLREDSGIPH